jgi:hypothetical protein
MSPSKELSWEIILSNLIVFGNYPARWPDIESLDLEECLQILTNAPFLTILIIAFPAAIVVSQPETLRSLCAMPGIDSIIDPSYWRRNEQIFLTLLASFSMRGQNIPALVYKDISTFGTPHSSAINANL